MATLKDICSLADFSVVCDSFDANRSISTPFCCDLLSIAMGKAKADSCWVTVMANVNTLAVASLADVSCIILAESAAFDSAVIEKAKEQGIAVFATDLPVFEAALRIYELQHA